MRLCGFLIVGIELEVVVGDNAEAPYGAPCLRVLVVVKRRRPRHHRLRRRRNRWGLYAHLDRRAIHTLANH